MGQSADSQALAEAAQDDSKSRLSQGKESKRELMPFPLNPHFVSQSVLSEGLRLEIWKRVHVDKKSVRQVSVELGIEMRRVGAVVRLVEVEKKMKAEVRYQQLLTFYTHGSMMSTTHRLVYQTFHHGVQNNKLQLSDLTLHHPPSSILTNLPNSTKPPSRTNPSPSPTPTQSTQPSR